MITEQVKKHEKISVEISSFFKEKLMLKDKISKYEHKTAIKYLEDQIEEIKTRVIESIKQ